MTDVQVRDQNHNIPCDICSTNIVALRAKVTQLDPSPSQCFSTVPQLQHKFVPILQTTQSTDSQSISLLSALQPGAKARLAIN